MAAASDFGAIGAPHLQDLASLLVPVSLGEFFARYWERAPLFLRHRGAGYYDGLMTRTDLEALVADPDARYPSIRLARDGRYLPPEAYSKDARVGQMTFYGVPELARIAAEYAKGASIALTSPDRRWQPLRSLCERLEEALDYPLHSNIYLTPGRTAGFPPHYDTHDVLILQIAGRKRWFIDEPTVPLAHRTQPCNPDGYMPGPRLMEIELEPGDLLYLPRGFVHSTRTSESYSGHITLGIGVYTWADLVGDLLPNAIESEELRRGLPPGFASREELRPLMKERLRQLLPHSTAINLDQALDRIALAVQGAQRRPQPSFRADVVVIAPDTRLEVAPDAAYRLAPREDRVTLEYGGHNYVFPTTIAPMLAIVCRHSAFRAVDLADGGDAEVALTLARFLQNIGFIREAH
jgi:hypothetical protein